MEYFLYLVLIVVGILVYFAPTFIANNRNMASSTAVFLINLLFGWTLLPWLICLIWASEGRVEKKQTRTK